MATAGLILRAVSARVSSACGWLAFRLGLRRQARRHFERVLRLRGDDFSAYVHLGRLSYDAGDYAGWRREFEHARRADPERFARLRHPFELFEPRLAGTTFEDAGERATWRSLRPFGAAQRVGGQRLGDDAADRLSRDELPAADLPAAFDVPAPEPDLVPGPPPPAQDDCASSHERRRFDRLGPIRREEVEECDLDDLADRLTCD